MDATLQKSIKQWLPIMFMEANATENQTDTALLHPLEVNNTELINMRNSENIQEPFKVTDPLCQGGNLHDKTSIENKFLSVTALEESPAMHKKHLDLISKELRIVYIKIIL